ncbi:MAG: GTP cyclohydrolase I FolE, partial [Actinomycetota bacterium]
MRVVPCGTAVDLGAAERAAAEFLTALGMDTQSENLRDTPRRMAQ